MPIVSSPGPPGQGGARADDRRPPISERTSRKAGRAIDYPFDPIPQAATDMVASKQPLPPRPQADPTLPPRKPDRLMPFDLEVLAKLLRFARRIRTSCWTTRAFLAAELHVSEATIKRSLDRLQRAGLVRHVQVETPDPDEPRNRTGWRYVFAWMEAAPSCAPAGSSVTPGGDQARPLPGLIRDPQHKTEGNPILPEEGKNEINPTTTADAAGSSSDDLSDLQEKTPDADADDDGLARLVGRAEERFGGNMRARIVEAISVFGRGWVEAAVWGAPRLREWGGVLDALKRWKREDGPPERVVKAAKAEMHAASPEGKARRAAMLDGLAAGADNSPPKHRQAAEEALAAEKARADAMTPEERQAEAARLLEGRRGCGQDFAWDEPTQGYHPIVLDPDRWSPSAKLQAIVERMELFRPEIRAILDAERAAPGFVDPREAARQRRERQLEEQRLRAEAEARAKRRDEARKLIDQAGRYYFAITDAGDGLELADAFPAGDVSPDEKARIERAKLCRQGIRGRLLRELNEAAAEVREALAARSEVAS